MSKKSEKNIEVIINESWNSALGSWNHPSIPRIITVSNNEDFKNLDKDIAAVLKEELAFMTYPEFQTYANLKNIKKKFSNFEKGVRVVFTHEPGHRFCPYDSTTSLILASKAEKILKESNVKYDAKTASRDILNLFSDTCINTHLIRTGNNDLVWAYQELGKNNNSALWKVYAASLENCWNKKILFKDTILSTEEKNAAENLARLFERNVLEMNWWEQGMENYTRIIAPFLKQEDDAKSFVMSSSASGNIPKEIDIEEIARRLAKQGSNGLPTNKDAVKDFRELMAGYGFGNPIKASIAFYENLAKRYNVRFASKPFGRPRSSPFSLDKWEPSDPIEDLDVQQSIQSSGVLIPGVTTAKWKSRVTNAKHGEREVMPALDIYLDSSGSMDNPINVVSLPVIACFVASKRAKNSGVRVINHDRRIVASCDRTKDLDKVYEVLVSYGGGGTKFPVKEFLEYPEQDPRLALIVTDTFLGNTAETCEVIQKFKKRNKNNKVSIYAITNIPDADELVNAGAECIQGTTTNIFNQILGKTERTYIRK